MSSFAGRMKEYPTISLDRFDRENLHARAYFLSHCHKDHMKGLKGPFLKRKLKFSRTVKLYCSFVTKELLLSNPKYAFWEEHIVPLELDSPTQIYLVDEATGEKEDLLVTLLPAGHCPGSVMFLFEGSQGNVLYTGDFRLAQGDASRIELLHSGSRVKDIQSVYLDSTFYDHRYYRIPSREACLSGIRELVSSWISQSAYHVVWLNCKAAYGYEYLFTNLGEEFNTQIHVNSLAMFKKMPEILSYVTTNRKAQIHACRHPKMEEYSPGNRLPCHGVAPDGSPLHIISIKPSTIWFGERSKRNNVVVKTGSSSYRACFSFHSSYSELKDFLTYLQPVNIYPSVIPIGRTLLEVTEMLKPLCRNQAGQAAFIYRPLGEVKRTRAEQPTYDSDSGDGLFEGPDLAPARKRTALNQGVNSHGPLSTAVPVAAEELVTLNEPVAASATDQYMDCTESNDEEEDEEEEMGDEEEETGLPSEGKGETSRKAGDGDEQEHSGNKGVCRGFEAPRSSPKPGALPEWDDFFTNDTLPDSQNSLNSQPLSCCSAMRLSGSQTPELFYCSDSESADEAFGAEVRGGPPFLSACPTSLSNPVSLSQGTSLPDILIPQSEQQEQELGGAKEPSSANPGDLPDSQTSSDFDIPCTPESQTPKIEDLTRIYKTLASGEEVSLIRKGSQGSN